MAWTYYTAPLTAGQELTANMWYELCEALAERLDVTNSVDCSYRVDLTTAAAIRDSGLQCRRVPIRIAGGAVRMLAWVGDVFAGVNVGRWAENTTTSAALSTSAFGEIVAAAWTAEGLDEAGFGELSDAVDSYYTEAGWNDRRFWNIIRATIRRLQVARWNPASAGYSSTFRGATVSAPPSSWSALVTDFLASDYTGGPAGLYSQVYARSTPGSTSLTINAAKTQLVVTFPTVTPLATADVWVFLTEHYVGTTDTVSLTIGGGAPASIATGSLSDTKLVIGSGININGAQTLTMKLAGWDNPAAYEPMANGVTNELDVWVVSHLHIAPTWSKP
jgi:hypothetical protein